MKSFKQFLNEETMPYATNAKGIIDIENSSVRDGLNSQIAGVTAGKFVTPYIALERVSKALANYHISIPRHSFLEGDSGMFVWPINQFGIKFGQNNDGTFVQDGEVLKDTSKGIHPEGEDNKVVSEPNRDIDKPFSVFFEYRQSDCGMFNVFCEVISQEELDEILADLEAELNDEGEEEDEDEEEKLNEEAVDEACWKGYRKEGMKKMFGKMYPNCVKVDEERLDELSKETLKSYKEKQLFSKDKSPLQSYNRLVGLARANKKIKAKEDIKEQKVSNRASDSKNDEPLKDRVTIPGASTPVPSGSFSPRVPSRNTKGLDNMNRDAEGNTVVEGSKENKEKKKQALIAQSGGKKKLRDIRSAMKDKVNKDFDPRALKVAEETEE